MEIKSVGVVGAGKMGSGIALSAAQAGYDVVLKDMTEALVEKAVKGIGDQIDRLVRKGATSSEEGSTLLGRIRGTDSFEKFDLLDFVIESVTESFDVKIPVLKQLDEVCRGEAIIVSNTSTFSITRLAAASTRPGQFAGMHFFIPPTKLVEVTRGYYTSDETVGHARAVARKMGKLPVEVKKDSPGFIANRIYTPVLYEAFRVYEEGIASKEEIDLAMKNSYLPVGPFELADIIGLDVLIAGWEYFHQELGPTWRPPQSLKQLVSAGRLGKKVGRGWYDY